MRTPTSRRLLIVILSLAAAGLGCARANSLMVPVTPDYATRQPPTATNTTEPPTPTATVPSPTPEPVTATPETPPTDTPTVANYPPPATAEPTLPPTDTPMPPPGMPTLPPTHTPQPPPGMPTLPPTNTPPSAPTTAPATPAGPLPTIAPQIIQAVPIPAGATFTQQMVVTGQGGEMSGDPGYLVDNRTVTWAALDGGHTAWVFDLGSAKKIGGVKVYAQKPRDNTATTLLAIEVSNDGQNWQAVLVGTGNCGEPNCDAIPQTTFTPIGFNPVSARYLRLRSGPNRFGFAEVLIAIVP